MHHSTHAHTKTKTMLSCDKLFDFFKEYLAISNYFGIGEGADFGVVC